MSTTSADVHQDPHGGGQDPHGAGHDPHHQHHFATMEQQFDTSKIGMWLFLVTEVLTFGGLFAGFGILQGRYPDEFVEAHEHLQRLAGATNTVRLLDSSFTMGMAVFSTRTTQSAPTAPSRWLSRACPAIFMCGKAAAFNYT